MILTEFRPKGFELVAGQARAGRGGGFVQENRGNRAAEAMAGPSSDVLVLAVRGFPASCRRAEKLVVLEHRRGGLVEGAVLSFPGQVVVHVGEPCRVVAGGDGRFEQAVGAGADDVLTGGDVGTRGGNQDVVPEGLHRVDTGVAACPGLVDRVGLGRPVVEVPGLASTLADLDERRLDRIGLLRAGHLEGVPAVGVHSHFLSVTTFTTVRAEDRSDLALGGFDGQSSAVQGRYIDPEVEIARLVGERAPQRNRLNTLGLVRPRRHGHGHQGAHRPDGRDAEPVANTHASSPSFPED